MKNGGSCVCVCLQESNHKIFFLLTQGQRWAGVDIDNEGTCDTFKKFVWEPTLLKVNVLQAATEAACMILSVDETVRNPKSEAMKDDRPVPKPRR